MEKSISTQYNNDNLAKDYHMGSENFKEKDPGRNFLYSHIDSFDKNSSVVDIGCGSGIDLAEYRKLGFTNLSGIDPSEKILEEAKVLSPETVFLVGDFEHIKLPENSVDVITSRHALHYSRDIKTSLKNVHRALKPGGFFIAVISNPKFDSSLPTDQQGNINVTLFGGKVSITFPRHSYEEYFSEEFYRNFDLIEKFEYNDPERDDYVDSKNNTLAFVVRKKI